MSLYCHFNPDHDYALANGDENFVSPASAVCFTRDCRDVLSMAFPGSVTDFDESVTRVEAWGWNRAVRKQLHRQGVPMELMPSDRQLGDIRDLAHRRTSAYAMKWLKERMVLDAEPAMEIESIEQADVLVLNAQGPMLLKWPYSSNGTGIVLIPGNQLKNWMSLPAREQCRKQLARFGSVMAEPCYDVVQDFAMEFECREGSVQFCGYSLFQTEKFSYSCNLLMSDSAIEEELVKYTSRSFLRDIAVEMAGFLNSYVAGRYSGIVGVDMFIYRKNGKFCVNPAVELNFRHTMGWLARSLYDLHVVPPNATVMRIDRSGSHYRLVFE